MAVCNMCSAEMPLDQSTAYTSAELEGMVARGFEPPEPIMRKALAAGLSREQVVARWKWGLRQKSTWILCPECAARAAEYRLRPAGARPDDPPRWPPVRDHAAVVTPPYRTAVTPARLSPAAPAKQTPAQPWRKEQRPARRRRVPALLIGLLVLIALVFIVPFLDGGALSSSGAPSPTPTPPAGGPASFTFPPAPAGWIEAASACSPAPLI